MNTETQLTELGKRYQAIDAEISAAIELSDFGRYTQLQSEKARISEEINRKRDELISEKSNYKRRSEILKAWSDQVQQMNQDIKKAESEYSKAVEELYRKFGALVEMQNKALREKEAVTRQIDEKADTFGISAEGMEDLRMTSRNIVMYKGTVQNADAVFFFLHGVIGEADLLLCNNVLVTRRSVDDKEELLSVKNAIDRKSILR